MKTNLVETAHGCTEGMAADLSERVEAFNDRKLNAYCALSRSELIKMLASIPEDTEIGDAACGIFVSELHAQPEDGQIQLCDLSTWVRLPGEATYRMCRYPTCDGKEIHMAHV